MTTETLDQRGADSATLDELVDQLIDHGVTLPALAKYKQLRVVTTDHLPPEVKQPDNLLHREPAELIEYAQLGASRDVLEAHLEGISSTPWQLRIHALNKALEAELKAAIRDGVSQIITELSTPFNESAAVMAHAVKLGITPGDDLRSLFEAPGATRTAWLNTHHHAAKLDALLTLRQQLSFVAGVAPSPDSLLTDQATARARGKGSGIDWTDVVSNNPAGPRLEPFNPATPWRRWIKLGAHLELVDPAGMTPFKQLQATRPELAQALLREANRRAALPEAEPAEA